MSVRARGLWAAVFQVGLMAAGCTTGDPVEMAGTDTDAAEDASDEHDADDDGGEPDAGDGGADASRPYCRWEEYCPPADAGACAWGWRCGCEHDGCDCPRSVDRSECFLQRRGEQCQTASDCSDDEFCSERRTCGARCAKPEGCAGEPCLGDESCAEHEYCSNAETCAVRCTESGGCLDQPCGGDLSCGTDEYCSKEKRCAPRCSAELGCAGPELLRGHTDRALSGPWPVVSDGEKVYYARSPGRSTDGNELATDEPENLITAWDLRGEPSKFLIYNMYIYDLAVRDGFLYVLGEHPALDTTLYRTSVEDGLVTGNDVPYVPHTRDLVGEGIERTWFTDDALWWSQRASLDSDSARELWRVARAGEFTPVRIASAKHLGWLAGNESVAVRSAGSEPEWYLIQDTLPDLTPSMTIGTYGNPPTGRRDLVLVDDQSLFLAQGENGTDLVRILLDGSGATEPVAPADQPVHNLRVAGAWVYWGAELEDGLASINRRPRDLSGEPEELMRGELDPKRFTVTDDSLVYFDGTRFFVKQLP